MQAIDTRKVQTAVHGSPDSLWPVSLPLERTDAELLLHKYYSDKEFYCGAWLGGCGRKLKARVGKVRVPHFAHYPDHTGAQKCRRVTTDVRSADHLYIRRDLTTWLKDQGRHVGQVSIEGTIPGEGGVCTGLTIAADDGLITVALRGGFGREDLHRWRRTNEEMREQANHINWLFAEGLPLEQVFNEYGYALLIRCEYQGPERVVKIGVQQRGRLPLWSDLSECSITDSGLWTPHVDEVRKIRLGNDTGLTTESDGEPLTNEIPSRGFRIAGENVRIRPLAATYEDVHKVNAMIGSAAADILDRRGVVILSAGASPLETDREYVPVGDCLLDAAVTERNELQWIVHAYSLAPLDRELNEHGYRTITQEEATETSRAKSPDTTLDRQLSPELIKFEELLRKLEDGQKSNNIAYVSKLITHGESQLASLPKDKADWARQEIGKYYKWLRSAAPDSQPTQQTSQEILRKLEFHLGNAWSALKIRKPSIAQRHYEAALEQYPQAPIEHVERIQERLENIRQILTLANSRDSNQIDRLLSQAKAARRRNNHEEADQLVSILEVVLPLIPSARSSEWEARLRAARRQHDAVPIIKSPDATTSSSEDKDNTPQQTTPAPPRKTHHQGTQTTRKVTSRSERKQIDLSKLPRIDKTLWHSNPGHVARVVAMLRSLLEATARSQKLTTWHQLNSLLPFPVLTDDLQKRLLVEIDSTTNTGAPLLSSLITLPNGQMHPLYLRVAEELGRFLPESEEGQRSHWANEVLRVHEKWRLP